MFGEPVGLSFWYTILSRGGRCMYVCVQVSVCLYMSSISCFPRAPGPYPAISLALTMTDA